MVSNRQWWRSVVEAKDKSKADMVRAVGWLGTSGYLTIISKQGKRGKKASPPQAKRGRGAGRK